MTSVNNGATKKPDFSSLSKASTGTRHTFFLRNVNAFPEGSIFVTEPKFFYHRRGTIFVCICFNMEKELLYLVKAAEPLPLQRKTLVKC